MSGRQVIVLWLVLGLIVMNLFFTGQWTEIKGQLTVKAPAGSKKKAAAAHPAQPGPRSGRA